MIDKRAGIPTTGQSLAAQVAQLTAAGAKNVFREVATGAQTDHTQLGRARPARRRRLVVCLRARPPNVLDPRPIGHRCGHHRPQGWIPRSLGGAWADTTTPHGSLVLILLGELVEFEGDLIQARTCEGRVRTKARSQSLGRPYKFNPQQRQEALTGEANREPVRSYLVKSATS
jgi:hypothetical protein